MNKWIPNSTVAFLPALAKRLFSSKQWGSVAFLWGDRGDTTDTSNLLAQGSKFSPVNSTI